MFGFVYFTSVFKGVFFLWRISALRFLLCLSTHCLGCDIILIQCALMLCRNWSAFSWTMMHLAPDAKRWLPTSLKKSRKISTWMLSSWKPVHPWSRDSVKWVAPFFNPSGLHFLSSLSFVVCASLKTPQQNWFTVTFSFGSWTASLA